MSCFFLMIRPPPRCTLFPCTTLFRSEVGRAPAAPVLGRRRDAARLGDLGVGRLGSVAQARPGRDGDEQRGQYRRPPAASPPHRSEEHKSELQSRQYLVCRLLLEKKKR